MKSNNVSKNGINVKNTGATEVVHNNISKLEYSNKPFQNKLFLLKDINSHHL